MEHIEAYITALRQTMEELDKPSIRHVISVLQYARTQGNQVFIMGNGGSAATASHFVCDLAKNTRRQGLPSFRVIGLTDNMSIFSAYANDEGYEHALSEQLASLIQPGDVVIGISASGNSKNVINAIEEAQKHTVTTIGFTGFDGGRLGKIVDLNVHVKSNIIEHVEDIHLMLEHLIVQRLREQAELRADFAAPIAKVATELSAD